MTARITRASEASDQELKSMTLANFEVRRLVQRPGPFLRSLEVLCDRMLSEIRFRALRDDVIRQCEPVQKEMRL